MYRDIYECTLDLDTRTRLLLQAKDETLLWFCCISRQHGKACVHMFDVVECKCEYVWYVILWFVFSQIQPLSQLSYLPQYPFSNPPIPPAQLGLACVFVLSYALEVRNVMTSLP